VKYIAYHALKTPVEEVFQKFAYLEVELWPVSVDFSSAWTYCSRVNCGGSQPTSVTLLTTASFATMISENFLGSPELCSDERSGDIIRELANVLAGQAFDIMNAGRRPQSIAIPESLDPAAAAKAWANATPKTKFLLVTENEVVGGMIITVAGSWSSSWE
jgi:hypothetical protein